LRFPGSRAQKLRFWAVQNHFNIEVSLTKFGMDIKKYKGVRKQRNKHYTTINININELKTYLINKYLIEFNESLFINDKI
jgi:hypothetical protein